MSTLLHLKKGPLLARLLLITNNGMGTWVESTLYLAGNCNAYNTYVIHFSGFRNELNKSALRLYKSFQGGVLQEFDSSFPNEKKIAIITSTSDRGFLSIPHHIIEHGITCEQEE